MKGGELSRQTRPPEAEDPERRKDFREGDGRKSCASERNRGRPLKKTVFFLKLDKHNILIIHVVSIKGLGERNSNLIGREGPSTGLRDRNHPATLFVQHMGLPSVKVVRNRNYASSPARKGSRT